MLRINLVLFGLTALFWLAGVFFFPFELNSRGIQHQIFLLTGLAAWFLWAEALVIAARPRWIERVAGEPLDRLMGAHRKLGWGMAAASLLHVAAPVFVAFLPVEQVSGMAERPVMGSLAEAVWIWLHPLGALTGILLTLYLIRVIWRDARRASGKLDWTRWEKSHRAWAWVYLFFILHAVRLMKETELAMPLGWLNVAVTLLGAWAAVSIIRRRPGSALRAMGEVVSVQRSEGEFVLVAKSALARSVRPGEFAYLSLPCDREDPHPFTVVAADPGKGTVSFWIKEAGDWTRALAARKPGSELEIEGPWGSFLPVWEAGGPQSWIAGGLGLAPFIAWLEAAAARRRSTGEAPRATLWWFVRHAGREPFLPEAKRLAEAAGIELRVFETGDDHRGADPALVIPPGTERVEVCGSRAFALAFRRRWKELGGQGAFRSEAC